MMNTASVLTLLQETVFVHSGPADFHVPKVVTPSAHGSLLLTVSVGHGPCVLCPALPVEVFDRRRRSQDQKPQLSAGEGAEAAAHRQQAAADRHTPPEQPG